MRARVFFSVVLLTGCNHTEDGTGGAASSGSTTSTTSSETSTGTSASVPMIDAALDGHCPAGSKPPGTGVGPGDELHKVTLDAYPDALCNDGSPAIMYVRAASAPAAANAWVIHLQPGGACGTYAECLDRWCAHDSNYDAAKMSSRFAPEATNGSGLFARNAANSLGPANQVYVYYCSSDAWTGQRSDHVFEDPEGANVPYRLHFKGFQIVQAVNDALQKGATSDDGVVTLPSLSSATRILFSGSSAGSMGQTHALDWWASQYPSAKTGGFFDSISDPLPEDFADTTVGDAFRSSLQQRFELVDRAVYDAHHDESCAAAHTGDDAWLCSLGTHVRLNHVTTPFFVRQDLRDPVQYGYVSLAGATVPEFAVALEKTMGRFTSVVANAEETVAVPPGVHASNCGQHIVALNSSWFGVAAMNNATVEDAGGTPITVHDGISAWAGGASVVAIDTHPSTTSVCIGTTTEQ